MTENLEKEAGMPVDIEEAEKTASEDVVAQREEALAKQLAEMKRRKKKLVDPLQFEMSIQAEDQVLAGKWDRLLTNRKMHLKSWGSCRIRSTMPGKQLRY